MIDICLSDGELNRYSRQILLDEWDINAQIALKSSSVVIIGMGGLGCPVAQILVRAGVGRIHLIDFDVIDDSNLQRQALYLPSHIGQSKVKIAYYTLRSTNEFSALSYNDIQLTQDNINALSWNFSLMIDCTDNFSTRKLLNTVSVQQTIPLLSASAIGTIGQLSLFEPTKTGCYACLFGENQTDNTTCATSGVLGSTVAVIGAMAADVALAFLGQDKNTLFGKLALWNGQTTSLRHIHFKPNRNCPVCQIMR